MKLARVNSTFWHHTSVQTLKSYRSNSGLDSLGSSIEITKFIHMNSFNTISKYCHA